MKYLATLLLILGFGLSGFGQTIKSLGYNTTNGQVVANTTNTLTFTNAIAINGTAQINIIEPYGGGSGISILDGIIIDTNGVGGEAFSWGSGVLAMGVPISFATTNIAATTRANLGFHTNLNTLWTATNASNARSAVGLDATNSVTFQRITVDPSASAAAFRFGTNHTGLWSGADDNYRSFFVRAGGSSLVSFETNRILFFTNVVFDGGSSGVVAAQTRTNLGLGGGITATNTFVSYDGTNYTTNTVTISNGIITGWTQ